MKKKQLTENLKINEIKIAINDLKNGKSPGIDGIPIQLGSIPYKAFWNDLKDILLELFVYILNSDNMAEDQKTSAVCLVHKGKERKKLENWRPISILCVDYKILAKILTNRLKPILSRVINPYQTGGIPDRNISENLCNTRNVILHHSVNNAALLNIDFSKAFDRVDREFIYQTMSSFNFPRQFIRWIQTLYESSSQRIILNGKMGGKITLERGIKQGCPLAMYLYIIYIEPLHIKIQNTLKGIKIGTLNLKMCGYVDDITVFIDDLDDFYQINSILKNFETLTNSKINREKTKLLGIGLWANLDRWPLTWLKCSPFIKILGVDFYPSLTDTTSQSYQKILRNVKGLLQIAECRCLTLPQRIVYFNTFVMPVVEFVAKVFPIPLSICKRIQSMGNTFIWRGKIEQVKIKEMHNTYEDGGFNLTNVTKKCEALFIRTLLQQFLTSRNICSNAALQFFIGIRLKLLKQIKRSPHQVTTNQIFMKAISKIKFLHKENPSTDWEIITTKAIYQLLIKKELISPKIIAKNPGYNFSLAFKNTKNKFISPTIKEHALLTIHNILTTQDRLQRCNYQNDGSCLFCQQRETISHLRSCRESTPAVKWLKRKILKRTPSICN